MSARADTALLDLSARELSAAMLTPRGIVRNQGGMRK